MGSDNALQGMPCNSVRFCGLRSSCGSMFYRSIFFGSMNALEINFLGCVNAPQFNFFWVSECLTGQSGGSRKAVRVKFCGLRMPCKECPTSQFFLRSQNALQFNVLQVSFWVVYECPTGHFWVCEWPASQFLRSRNTPRVDFWGLGMVCRSIF